MPELPEVETVRGGLESVLVGRRLTAVQVLNPRLRFGVPRDFARALEGRTVREVARRAKYLLLRTDGPSVLSHLGMTGTWQHTVPDHVARKHDHVLLTLDDGGALVYNDPRKFGFVDLIDPEREARHPRLRDLGPEPLDERAFTATYLAARFHRRRAPLKGLLMDQRIVVGVGNIYAAEALFRAEIHPLAKAGRVRIVRLERLVAAVRAVLHEAIAAGGSTIDDFRRTNGESGYFQHAFAVYDRAGEPCPRCNRALRSRVIAGRSSVYCARCQKR